MLIEALELAHESIRKLCAAQLELREQVGKAKWYDPAVERRARAALRRALRRARSPSTASPASRSPRTSCSRDELPPVAGDAGEDAMVRRTQVRSRPAMIARGRAACTAVVKARSQEQFGDALRELSDAEQDSKELKSAKRAGARSSASTPSVQLPFPARHRGRRSTR